MTGAPRLIVDKTRLRRSSRSADPYGNKTDRVSFADYDLTKPPFRVGLRRRWKPRFSTNR